MYCNIDERIDFVRLFTVRGCEKNSMGRFLNVGIIQMPVSEYTSENLEYIEKSVASLMSGFRTPELIVGVESISSFTPEYIPDSITEYFGKIAKKYGIYLIPGTLCEKSDELPEGKYYNTAPIFNPKGELVDIYRKMVPWRPVEDMVEAGNRYVVFDIPEKQTKIGVQICYDLNFPEISRNETLMGAEVLVKLTLDPQELYLLNRPIHFARALENQAFLVSTNAVGFHHSTHLYGHSMVIDPQGTLLWEAGETASAAVITLDLDLVEKCRVYGTMGIEHYIQHVRDYDLPMPFTGNMEQSPLFQTLTKVPKTLKEYQKEMRAKGISEIGNPVEQQPDISEIERCFAEFMEKRKNIK